jgi:hypothetical protein
MRELKIAQMKKNKDKLTLISWEDCTTVNTNSAKYLPRKVSMHTNKNILIFNMRYLIVPYHR